METYETSWFTWYFQGWHFDSRGHVDLCYRVSFSPRPSPFPLPIASWKRNVILAPVSSTFHRHLSHHLAQLKAHGCWHSCWESVCFPKRHHVVLKRALVSPTRKTYFIYRCPSSSYSESFWPVISWCRHIISQRGNRGKESFAKMHCFPQE